MATATDVSKEITLRYADKGTYRFSRIALSASDPQLYNLATVLNSFQSEPSTAVIRVITKLIV
jgi:hypothetical protein